MTSDNAARAMPIERDDAPADPVAALLDRVDLTDVERRLEPGETPGRLVAASARAAAVAQFRHYADQLERGELDGVRLQWREGLHHLECVELDAHPHRDERGVLVKSVRLVRYEIDSPERPTEP